MTLPTANSTGCCRVVTTRQQPVSRYGRYRVRAALGKVATLEDWLGPLPLSLQPGQQPGYLAGHVCVVGEAQQFRGPDGYARFQHRRTPELRFSALPGGQVRLATGHRPGRPEITVPAERFKERWVGDFWGGDGR